MISPESSVFETQQLPPIFDLHNVEADAWNLPLDGQGSGWSDPLMFSNNPFSMQELSSFDRSVSPADVILYSTLVDQANSDISLGMEDLHISLSEFSSSSIDFLFPSVLPAQDSGPYICSSPENWNTELPAHDDPTIGRVPQASNGVHESCISSTLDFVPTSGTNNSSPRTLYVNQVSQESFQTADSSTTPSAETPQRYLGCVQPGTCFGSPSLSFVDPAAWSGSSSCFEEVTRIADFESFGQQHIPFDGPLSFCRWKSECGSVCQLKITPESLPEHLSEHGIIKMTRDFPTKCNWDGCRRKKPMNRESIVRHIREVHLRLKRPSKRVQVLERQIQRNLTYP